ncbi:MAG: BrnT family toxin [Chloroflexi bacterium CFX6]|nr:BrnT family toxin [Chloroflexi bacterium CFX6]
MEFEFDPDKSTANQIKHGIDFVAAQRLWDDVNRLEIPARTEDEIRFALIALLDDGLWTAIFTMRNTRVRIISVRQAHANERRLYDAEEDSDDTSNDDHGP